MTYRFGGIVGAALVLALGVLGGVCAAAVAARAADDPVKRHAVSLTGTPAYGPDFQHFNWVNPAAPKGGRVRQWALGSFDSLNPFPVKGSPAVGLGLIYDTLMVASPDEASTSYGLVAEWLSYPDDFSSATFKLRAGAHFNDGTPITPADVIFSLGAIKQASPNQALYYKNVTKVEQTGPDQVTFIFDVKGNRELPYIIGQLEILPKDFYASVSVPTASRAICPKQPWRRRSAPAPTASRRWTPAAPSPTSACGIGGQRTCRPRKGSGTSSEITFVYFRDRVPAFEAFKSGQLDYWLESSAKNWATAFDFDAVKRGQVKLDKLPVVTVAPMQAFAFNTRRAQFQRPPRAARLQPCLRFRVGQQEPLL